MLEYETTTNSAKILQSTTGFTDNDLDTAALFPVVKKQLSGRSTGPPAQNVGNGRGCDHDLPRRSAAPALLFSATEPVRIAAATKQSTTYLDSALLPAGCLASAEATATGNIAGVVNEAFLPCTGVLPGAFPPPTQPSWPRTPRPSEAPPQGRLRRQAQRYDDSERQQHGHGCHVVFKTNSATTLNNLAIPAKQSKTLLDMTNTTAWPTLTGRVAWACRMARWPLSP